MAAAQSEPNAYFVVDTSSLLEVRRIVLRPRLPGVLRAMTRLVDTGELVFPTEVDDELERFRRPGAEDPIGDWVAASKRRATRFGPQFDCCDSSGSLFQRFFTKETSGALSG